MTINQKIIKALKPLGIPVTSDFFGGGNSEYITFNYVKAVSYTHLTLPTILLV